jgi:hypothetical protein
MSPSFVSTFSIDCASMGFLSARPKLTAGGNEIVNPGAEERSLPERQRLSKEFETLPSSLRTVAKYGLISVNSSLLGKMHFTYSSQIGGIQWAATALGTTKINSLFS